MAAPPRRENPEETGKNAFAVFHRRAACDGNGFGTISAEISRGRIPGVYAVTLVSVCLSLCVPNFILNSTFSFSLLSLISTSTLTDFG